MIEQISSWIMPLLVLFVVGYGIFKKINVYDVFVKGATESFDMVFTMFPCLLGMIFGINLFLKSDILNYIFTLLQPIFSQLNVPTEVFPMMILRPISGSSSLAILNNLFITYGPDSMIGRLGSVIQGSTDTTFYILTLYFGSVGIKKIRYSLWAGLAADVIGIVSAIIIVNLFFG